MTKRKLKNLIIKVLNGQEMTVSQFTDKVMFEMPLCVEISGIRGELIAEYIDQSEKIDKEAMLKDTLIQIAKRVVFSQIRSNFYAIWDEVGKCMRKGTRTDMANLGRTILENRNNVDTFVATLPLFK